MADMFADLKKEAGANNRKFEYLHKGAFTLLKFRLDAGEKIT